MGGNLGAEARRIDEKHQCRDEAADGDEQRLERAETEPESQGPVAVKAIEPGDEAL